jgi:glycosyltransferase involved in cell wall biosynthesis
MKGNKFPTVSIVIPTYNRANYLPEALESALAQTYPNIEIIVVNDGCTDNTEEVLRPYIKQIRYIKRENGGCAAAKNTGLQAATPIASGSKATGQFITNLDDDDRIHPEKVERQIEMFRQNPNLGICGTGVNFIDAAGQITERYMPPQFSRRTQVLQLLRKCLLIQSSVMICRECHEHLGNYKNLLGEDYELWLRIALHYDIGVVEEYLTDYRVHGQQITAMAVRPRLMADMEQILRDFVTDTPMEQIIPGLRSYPEGHAIIGLLLGEQKLFGLAETHFEHAMPNPAADFGLGLMHGADKQEFAEARTCFERVTAGCSPFVPLVAEALPLFLRMQAILQNWSKYDNMSPEVVAFRKDLSHFRAKVLRVLLQLAVRD